MKYTHIGNSDLNSSVIGLGALHFGAFINQHQSTEIIGKAIDNGINFIETSPIYGNGNSESYIKNSIHGKISRDKILLSTKAGLKPITRGDGSFGVDIEPLTKKYIRSSVEKSLKDLGTDYIDLFQLHYFDGLTPIEETFSCLEDLILEGKIRYIGCSNYDNNQLKKTNKFRDDSNLSKFVSCQVHYNLIERRAEDSIIPICKKENITLIVNRSLARGILSGKYKFNFPIPDGSRAQKSSRIRNLLEEDVLKLVGELKSFSEKHGHSIIELANSYIFHVNPNSIVLAGVRNTKQLEEISRSFLWNLDNTDYINGVNKIIKRMNMLSKVKERPETFFEK